MQVADLTDRQYYIDFLKVIGLTGIFIAHAIPPNWLGMLRSFDVPLMVMISSFLAARSYKKYEGSGLAPAKQYIFSRIKRLVIPVWIFLAFYFSVSAIYNRHFLSIDYYVKSFCLTLYGIGYVWIILIYIYSAMLVPLFSKLQLSIKGAVLVLLAYLVYETAFHFRVGLPDMFIESTFYYIVPYGLLTYLGCNYSRMNNKLRCCIIGFSFLVFIITGCYYWSVNGSPQIVQIAKYPPRLYYLSYGIMCSFFLFLVCENSSFRLFRNPLIKYISTHSMWIYLWHIFALSAYSALRLPNVWYVKFITVYASSLLTVFVIDRILDLLDRKRSIGVLKYLRG